MSRVGRSQQREQRDDSFLCRISDDDGAEAARVIIPSSEWGGDTTEIKRQCRATWKENPKFDNFSTWVGKKFPKFKTKFRPQRTGP